MNFVDFKEKKRFSEKYIIPALKDIGQNKKANNLKHCGDFKDIAVCDDCYAGYFDRAYFCRDRMCPVCNKARSLIWYSKLLGILPEILSKSKEYKLDMLTFTIKDTKTLKEGIDLLMSGFRYLMHDEKGIAKQFNSIYLGGLRALEVKRGAKSGDWHPHFHVLAIKKGKSNNFEFLKNAWEHSLNVVSGKPGKLGSVDVKYLEHDIRKGIRETIKYLTKSSFEDKDGKVTVNSCDLAEMVKDLKGVKSLSTWGNLRFYLTGDRVEEDLQKSNSDLEKCCCTYCGCRNFTVLSSMYSRDMQLNDFDHIEEEEEYGSC